MTDVETTTANAVRLGFATDSPPSPGELRLLLEAVETITSYIEVVQTVETAEGFEPRLLPVQYRVVDMRVGSLELILIGSAGATGIKALYELVTAIKDRRARRRAEAKTQELEQTSDKPAPKPATAKRRTERIERAWIEEIELEAKERVGDETQIQIPRQGAIRKKNTPGAEPEHEKARRVIRTIHEKIEIVEEIEYPS